MPARFKNIFQQKKVVIGMVHVQALPGTPGYKGNFDQIIETAVKEATAYKKAGIHAIGIENMHDLPYVKNSVGPEIVASMSRAAHEIKQASGGLPCGVQVLAAANKEALAVAKSAYLDFVRVEGFVYGHLADEGYIDSCAGELLRYRKSIDAESVAVFTDIKKKHSAHAMTADVDLVETAKTAEFFKSDGLIVTGTATGEEANLQEIGAVKKSSNLPVIVGSGVTDENISKYYGAADAFIIGSHFKKDGYWENDLDSTRIDQFMEVFARIG